MCRTVAVSAAHGGSRASLVVVSVVPSSECPNAGLGLGLKEAPRTALVELRSGPKECHPGDLSMHPRQPLVCSFPPLDAWCPDFRVHFTATVSVSRSTVCGISHLPWCTSRPVCVCIPSADYMFSWQSVLCASNSFCVLTGKDHCWSSVNSRT